MEFDFLQPVGKHILEVVNEYHPMALAHQTRFHSEDEGFPDLRTVKIAVFGVSENRNQAENQNNPQIDFSKTRTELYCLFPGNWHTSIADLGDILPGEQTEDTYYAVKTLVRELVAQDIIPVVLGGSQDLAYAQYRAYDDYGQMVNVVNIDACFDLGDAEKELTSKSYVSKMVVNQPYNLFNYANIGYQTYFNPQEEIELIEKLYFEAYRLGEVSAAIDIAEPVLRDANMATIDMMAVNSEVLGKENPPNGFNGKEICALARYAGISDKLTSFGVYHIHDLELSKNSSMLVAQILWYFFEGVNYRKNEQGLSSQKDFLTYKVPVDNGDEVLTFYKSEVSGRWWIEIPYSSHLNNKLKKHTLLPCTHTDYLEACNQVIPKRWLKAVRKNTV